MQLAYLVDSFPVTSETFVINEVDEVCAQGDSVFVLALNEPLSDSSHELGRQWRKRTIYLERLGNGLVRVAWCFLCLAASRPLRTVSALAWSLGRDKALRWRFRRCLVAAAEIKRRRAEHIHAHFASDAAEVAWIIAKITGVPFSVSTHGYDIYDNPYRYYKLLAADALFIRSVCDYNSKSLVRLGVPVEKITVVHCGIRLGQFNPDERMAKTIDVLCVGRLHPVKGVKYLIDAVCELTRSAPEISVCIVGDGSERSSLENYARDRGVSARVAFAGEQSQDQVRRLLSQAKVFCLPSLGDSVGVASMEAMAMQVPVVSTTVKGIPELVVDGVSGFLVPPANSKALAERLRTLLESETLREAMGQRARDFVREFFNQEVEVGKLRRLFRAQGGV